MTNGDSNIQVAGETKEAASLLLETDDSSTDSEQRKCYTLSIIIPVYNELNTILAILKRVLDVDVIKEIIIVDDGSTDGTTELLMNEISEKYENVTVFFHIKNRGKGAATRTGISHATGDYVVVQDADLEYDPRDYHKLLEPLLDGRADVVFGSRFVGGGPVRVCFFWHRVANALLTFLSNITTNLNLTDMEVCYKIFKREVIQSMTLRCDRFDFEPEVTAKTARWRHPDGRRCHVYEVPISYAGRDYSEGKKIGLKDAFQAIYAIVKYRFVN
jgi:glycosyltransferase involved in cell wall biosynthesis